MVEKPLHVFCLSFCFWFIVRALLFLLAYHCLLIFSNLWLFIKSKITILKMLKWAEMSSLFDKMLVPRSCSSEYSAHRAWEEDSPTASNDLGAGIASSLKRKKLLLIFYFFIFIFFNLVSALLQDCSLCWDGWRGTWLLHLTRPC